jgi:hypothetical protein
MRAMPGIPVDLPSSEPCDDSAGERRRILLMSVGILAAVSVVVGALALYVLYRAALREERARLTEVVESHARIIEAVARFDALHSGADHPRGAAAATLSQIAEAHETFEGFGATGEFTLARREADRIVFLLRHRHDGGESPTSVPFDSEVAEPMRRALRGESGTVVGLDYREAVVLAAYEPVRDLDWGVVAKIDLDEIRAPFIRAALLAGSLGLLVIGAGAAFVVRLTSPLIRRIEERTGQLRAEMAERSRAETELARARTLLLASLEEDPPGSIPVSVPMQPTTWRYFRAVAVDYDGTLTEGGRPGEDVLGALREIRDEGRRVLLVTGRILAELRHEFFDMDEWFDLIVAENGAVISRGNVSRSIASPISPELETALQNRGVPFRRGQVLLACDGEYAGVVFEELTRLGLDYQIVHNRGVFMVLPAGVSKGSGLWEALGALGISPHSTIAVGDAENDLSMLEECELGVAVANSVESLKKHADLILSESGAAGVASLLRGPIVRGETWVEPKRWRIEVGSSPENQPVTLPASQINLLITGAATGGKSYAAGLLAEQLIALKYSVCVLDPEGDHAPLGLLRGVTVIGGKEHLPSPKQLARIVERNLDSLVIDLSLLSPREKEAYIPQALEVLRRQRARTGLPHWIFADEAHVPLADRAAGRCFEPGEKGYCLVTYRPAIVCKEANVTFDYVLAVASEQDTESDVIESVSALTRIPAGALVQFLADAVQGRALLVRLADPAEVYPLILGRRAVNHVRHWHKYARFRLPPARRFYFWDSGGVAGNLEEFHSELRLCDGRVLGHHARHRDFSSWIQDVMNDTELAADARAIEGRLASADSSGAVEDLRRELLKAIEDRYLE